MLLGTVSILRWAEPEDAGVKRVWVWYEWVHICTGIHEEWMHTKKGFQNLWEWRKMENTGNSYSGID